MLYDDLSPNMVPACAAQDTQHHRIMIGYAIQHLNMSMQVEVYNGARSSGIYAASRSLAHGSNSLSDLLVALVVGVLHAILLLFGQLALGNSLALRA